MRYLLVILIFFLTTIDVLGWTASLAPGLSVKNALIYIIVLALAMRYAVQGGLRIELPKIQLWFGVLIVYATLTWLAVGLIIKYKSYTLVDSGIDLKAFLLDNAIVFVLYFYGTQSLGDTKFVLKCMLLAVTAANGIAIGNVAGFFALGVTPVGSEGNLAGRVFGAFGHANETAALTVCFLPAYVAAVINSAGLRRILWAGAGAVSAALMIMSGSRGAFLGLALGAVFGSMICRSLISWRRAAILAAVVVPIAVLVLAFVSIEFDDVLAQRVSEMIRNPLTSSDERVYIWRPILDKMMSNPVALITGFGWDAYDVMGFYYNVHNHYLWLWFELGIVGLVSYLMLVGQLVVTARRSAVTAVDETSRYLMAFIYGIVSLSIAVFFSQLFKPWLYIWIYCGLTMRMAVIADQNAERSVLSEQPRVRTSKTAPLPARGVAPNLRAPQRNA